MTGPALDRSAIAARIPHAGSMCLLDRVDSHDAARIRCSSASHRAAGNPLRLGGVLPAACGIEYAAQAMALHAGLAAGDGGPPLPGLLVGVRGVRLHVERLDGIAGDLHVAAERLAGDAGQALYTFTLHDAAGTLLVDGRATVLVGAAAGIAATAR